MAHRLLPWRMMVSAALLLVCLLLPVAAWSQDTPALPAVGDALYKGVVGKALDAVPMDPERRVVLQRTNAVVSNTLTARSLAAWAGLANPILWIGGLAWGIFAAANIKAQETAMPVAKSTMVETVARVDLAQEAGDQRLAACY